MRIWKSSVFPSFEYLGWRISVMSSPGLSRNRRRFSKLAIAPGSPSIGNVSRLPVASMPFSSRRSRVGNLKWYEYTARFRITYKWIQSKLGTDRRLEQKHTTHDANRMLKPLSPPLVSRISGHRNMSPTNVSTTSRGTLPVYIPFYRNNLGFR